MFPPAPSPRPTAAFPSPAAAGVLLTVSAAAASPWAPLHSDEVLAQLPADATVLATASSLLDGVLMAREASFGTETDLKTAVAAARRCGRVVEGIVDGSAPAAAADVGASVAGAARALAWSFSCDEAKSVVLFAPTGDRVGDAARDAEQSAFAEAQAEHAERLTMLQAFGNNSNGTGNFTEDGIYMTPTILVGLTSMGFAFFIVAVASCCLCNMQIPEGLEGNRKFSGAGKVE